MIGLNKTAVVWTPHATTGAYTVSAKTGLRCRLALRPAQAPDANSQPRAELIGERRLLWDEAYTMPSNAQVEIDSERWNVQPGTIDSLGDLGSTVVYRRCDVVKAVS